MMTLIKIESLINRGINSTLAIKMTEEVIIAEEVSKEAAEGVVIEVEIGDVTKIGRKIRKTTQRMQRASKFFQLKTLKAQKWKHF